MNSRERRKLAAAVHNTEREAQKALELDRKLNPEKYKRKIRKRTSRKAQAFIAATMMLSPNAFDDRLLRGKK
tara:strand:+ start:4059 stop:4274 length:216 start_codon:yes stop_codon:yes gene_type:complete